MEADVQGKKTKEANPTDAAPSVQQKRTLGLVILRGESIVSVTVEGPPPSTGDSTGGLTAGPGKGVPAGRGMPLGAGESFSLLKLGEGSSEAWTRADESGAAMAARPMAYARPPPGFPPGMPGLPPGMPPGFPGSLPPGMPPGYVIFVRLELMDRAPPPGFRPPPGFPGAMPFPPGQMPPGYVPPPGSS